jgi:ubiquinone/menaquinone biosynthesis C-methylase UbiE
MSNGAATPGETAVADPIVGFFERGARGYDLQLILERRALRLAASMAGPGAGGHVVDLAAGTGALAWAVVRANPGPGALTLVDGSPRMLQRARSRLRLAAPGARLVVADVRAVPLPDGCADVVTIGYLLHLIDPASRAQVLAEAHRLLRPGGRLVVVVHGSPPGRAGAAYRGAWRLLQRVTPRGVVGHGPIADLARIVGSGGFEVRASRRLPGVYWSEVAAADRRSEPAEVGEEPRP